MISAPIPQSSGVGAGRGHWPGRADYSDALSWILRRHDWTATGKPEPATYAGSDLNGYPL